MAVLRRCASYFHAPHSSKHLPEILESVIRGREQSPHQRVVVRDKLHTAISRPPGNVVKSCINDFDGAMPMLGLTRWVKTIRESSHERQGERHRFILECPPRSQPFAHSD